MMTMMVMMTYLTHQRSRVDPEIGSDTLLPRGSLPPPRLGFEYRLGLLT